MAKFLLALVVAYVGWLIWRGPRRTRQSPSTPHAARRAEPAGMQEARAVLGLDADADEAAIRAAHRRLIIAVHPDRGGSADLTRRINAARDALLQRPDLS